MKERIKGLIAGIIIGTILVPTAFAMVGTVTKELSYNDIKITLNGEEVEPVDVNGQYVEPFIIDGTTYLPVRGIASALELGVDWDSETNTVKLSSQSEDTLGNALLNEFNSLEVGDMSSLEIAETLVASPSLAFSGGAVPVEEGLLSGFDNYEVKGFKTGAMFLPMIGSIPFVGYVFELNDSAEASSFIAGLKDNANLRWNICVQADEMVTGSKDNKVFFVMCPKSLEQ